MGQVCTRVEKAETSLNVLLGMSEAEARARASAWPDVTSVMSHKDDEKTETLEFRRGRVTLYLTGDATVHHASYESMSGNVIDTSHHKTLKVNYK